jgi:hypothetical protein
MCSYYVFLAHSVTLKCPQCSIKMPTVIVNDKIIITGADPRGGGRIRRAPPPPPPLKLEKNMIFWRKIVIFHTNYPKNVRASLRSAQFFEVRPP